MHKTLIGGVALLVVLIGVGAVVVIQKGDASPQSGNIVTGVVTAVDLTPMTYDGPGIVTIETADGPVEISLSPRGFSMCAASPNVTDAYLIQVGDSLTVTGERTTEGRIVPCTSATHRLTVQRTVNDPKTGLAFTYRVGPDGYVLLADGAQSVNQAGEKDFVAGYTLMLRTEYEEMQASTAPREGPPAIRVAIFKNPNKLHPGAWVAQNPLLSNGEMAQEEPTEMVIDGANAVRYTVDGLYLIDTLVAATSNYVYVFTGAYFDEGTTIRNDFQPLLNSVRFNGSQAYEPTRATLTGTYLCLPHVDGSTTEECAAGLKVGNIYYAIDFGLMSQTPPAIKAGDRLSASGVVTPVERLSTDHWRRYPVTAIFSVTDSVTVNK